MHPQAWEWYATFSSCLPCVCLSFNICNTHCVLSQGNQQPRPFYRSPLNSFPRGYPRGGIFHDTTVSGFGVDGRFYVDKRRRGREIDSFCGCNVAVDVLNEQNKGPRASRSKNAELERSSPAEAKSGESAPKIKNISYNQQDFLAEYEDAKFFIIKSYSEDNVHKSIKYGVWASTTSGNRRLDAAYQEAKEKEGSCPVFLLFSVFLDPNFYNCLMMFQTRVFLLVIAFN